MALAHSILFHQIQIAIFHYILNWTPVFCICGMYFAAYTLFIEGALQTKVIQAFEIRNATSNRMIINPVYELLMDDATVLT